ncbi:glycerate dehydrogenase [Xylariomycetidae sp. FL2044]|nr:glycerate dehydrogenase [Xylariomycetidae sp. FL2044]
MAQKQTHFVIVAFETDIVPLPADLLPAPYTYELRTYGRTTGADEIRERIRDADIALVIVLPLTAEILAPAVTPNLKGVFFLASGTDSADLAACRSRGIAVSNTPHCNATAVSEHAIALYFAARRSVARVSDMTRAGAWTGFVSHGWVNGPDGRPPRTCRDEVLGIVGYGAVGKKIEALARALGMKTLISGRKGVSAAAAAAAKPEEEKEEEKSGRTDFDTLIRTCSVVVLSVPRTAETLNLLSHAEFDAMPRHAVLVNVSRGGVVDEAALVAALRAGRIAGAATDVFAREPANPGNSPLLAADTAGLNLVTTPHVAWCAEDTNASYGRALKENLKGWLETGRPKYHVA